jgi:hypothetical protein
MVQRARRISKTKVQQNPSVHTASAALIPTLVGIIPGAEPGLFTWVYDLTLTEASRLDSAAGTNFFTLYDFDGFVGFGFTPFGWSPSVSLVGLTPAKALPDNDPGITNVSWMWSGPTFILGPLITFFVTVQVVSTLAVVMRRVDACDGWQSQ